MVACPKPKKVKKKKVKKPTLAKMRKMLDRIWFETIYLRDKGTCQKCGRKDTLAAHHIFGKKAYPAGRWNLDNGLLLCYADHIYWAHSKPYEVELFMKDRNGLFWYDDLFKEVKLISQFRSCYFDRIKGELESEQTKLKSNING